MVKKEACFSLDRPGHCASFLSILLRCSRKGPETGDPAIMLVFAIRRLLQAIPILLGVSLVVFGLVHIVPGNPIDMLMPPEASPEVIAQMRAAAFGFDKPSVCPIPALAIACAAWRLLAFPSSTPAPSGVNTYHRVGQYVHARGPRRQARLQHGDHLWDDRGAASWAVAGQAVLRHRHHRGFIAALLVRDRSGPGVRGAERFSAGPGNGG